MTKKNKTGAIIMATEAEAGPLIRELGLKETESKPLPVFKKRDILLVISGIGKANSAMATAFACVKYKPTWVLNPGAAGATRESANLGDIFQAKKILEPDKPHFRAKNPFIQFPDILEGFPAAVLATQDKGISDKDTFRDLSAIADLVDMEGASILQTCKRFEIPCHIFKFVSDTPVHVGKGAQIMENIKKYSIPFSLFIVESVISRLNSDS
jgi:nucleoside phosphorylase